jgi:hypothetical protein
VRTRFSLAAGPASAATASQATLTGFLDDGRSHSDGNWAENSSYRVCNLLMFCLSY